jgi:hypothetical protein
MKEQILTARLPQVDRLVTGGHKPDEFSHHVGLPIHVQTHNGGGPAGWGRQPGQDPKYGGFSRTIGADDSTNLAPLHVKRDIIQRRDRNLNRRSKKDAEPER